MENPLEMEVLLGKSSINGPFSMAMLNNQLVYMYVCIDNRAYLQTGDLGS